MVTPPKYRANKYLDELEVTGIGEDETFDEDYMRTVYNASKTLFSDMCRVYGLDDPRKLTPEAVNNPGVVKSQMAVWLFTAVYMLQFGSLLLTPYVHRQESDRKTPRRKDC